jgi:hypothetical protein
MSAATAVRVDLSGELPHQRRLYRSGFPGSMTAMVGPLGSGKTHSLVVQSILLALRFPGQPGLVVEPIHRQIADVFLPEWRRVTATLFPWLRWEHKRSESLSLIELPQLGVVIRLRSAESPGTLVGLETAWAGIDEPGRVSDEAFAIVASRVRFIDPANECRQIFTTGTPEGTTGWFAERFAEPAPPCATIWAKSRPAHLDFYGAWVADAFAGQPGKLQAYNEGRFVDLYQGGAYPAWNRDLLVSEAAEFRADRPLVLCCDFNWNPTAWVVGRVDGDRILLFDDISVTGTTDDAVAEFLRRYPRERTSAGEIRVYGDASGFQRRSSSPSTDWQMVREGLQRGGYAPVLDVPESNPRVDDRLNVVARLQAQGRMLVHPRCANLIRSFSSTRRRPNGDIEKGGAADFSHWGDAAGYACCRLFPILGKPVVSTNAAPLAAGPPGFRWDKRLAAGF